MSNGCAEGAPSPRCALLPHAQPTGRVRRLTSTHDDRVLENTKLTRFTPTSHPAHDPEPWRRRRRRSTSRRRGAITTPANRPSGVGRLATAASAWHATTRSSSRPAAASSRTLRSGCCSAGGGTAVLKRRVPAFPCSRLTILPVQIACECACLLLRAADAEAPSCVKTATQP